MKKLLYILFCITLISCNSKKVEVKEEAIVFSDNGTTIYESDVYEVINVFFEDEKTSNILDGIDFKGELLSVYPSSYYVHTEELKEVEIVAQEDQEFISKQINLDKYDIKQELFSDFKIIPRVEIENMWNSYNMEEFSKEFKSKYQKSELYYITIPLFSKDKNTAI